MSDAWLHWFTLERSERAVLGTTFYKAMTDEGSHVASRIRFRHAEVEIQVVM